MFTEPKVIEVMKCLNTQLRNIIETELCDVKEDDTWEVLSNKYHSLFRKLQSSWGTMTPVESHICDGILNVLIKAYDKAWDEGRIR